MMFARLTLPLMCAPMSFASSVELTVSCATAGIVAGWQGAVFTPLEEFARYLAALSELDAHGPAIVNIHAKIADDEIGRAKLDMLEKHRAPLVLSSIGDPSALVPRVHAWGGRLIQDVTTVRHAEKAIEVGADGLMATCAGAGGQTGLLTPFAFIPAIRKFWDGLLIVAGGIADPAGIAGALAIGGDIACMGTRFIATPESAVPSAHRKMIAKVGIDRIVVSAAVNGLPANWVLDSLEEAGLSPEQIAGNHRVRLPEGVRAWRNIFSAGQSAGLIDRIEPVTDLINRLREEFAQYDPQEHWRERLNEMDRLWAGAAKGSVDPALKPR